MSVWDWLCSRRDRSTDADGQAIAVAAPDSWPSARQYLSTLRSPEEWFESVTERVAVTDTHRHRTVTVQLSSASESDEFGERVLFTALTPHKGLLVPMQLEAGRAHDGSATVLSHREHEDLASNAILFRYRSLILALRRAKISVGISESREVLEALISIPRISTAKAAEIMTGEFDEKGWLSFIPNHVRSRKEVELDAALLHALCSLLAERYIKVIRLRHSAKDARPVTYSYTQELEDRTTRWRVPMLIRNLFRAPSGTFSIHVPWARLAHHYEFRLEGIQGYFANSISVTTSAVGAFQRWLTKLVAAVRQPRARTLTSTTEETGEPAAWVAKTRGVSVEPSIFIGEGRSVKTRLYVRVQFRETPPGYTGRALTYHVVGLMIAVSIILWAYFHEPTAAAFVVGSIGAFFALGAAAVDAFAPRTPILNAPFLPRLFMFFVAIEQLILTAWLLLRSTKSDVHNPFAETRSVDLWPVVEDGVANVYDFLLEGHEIVGPLVVAAMIGQTLILGIRAVSLSSQFGQASRGASSRTIDKEQVKNYNEH